VIDFSDNDIKKLDNFPVMRRLDTLIINNNYISKIGDNLGEKLVSLTALVLTNNRLTSLTELHRLSSITTLQHLSLLENPVAAQNPQYRLYMIFILPSLKSLDYRKVERKEREAAQVYFGSGIGKDMSDRIVNDANAKAPPRFERIEKPLQPPAPTLLTEDQKRQIRAAIEAATTSEEIDMIEKQIKVRS
jgi:U2 small nuclear ribonucleoprotein A'